MGLKTCNMQRGTFMKPSLVIVGLGNPGKEYEDTRHNAGFWAIETLAAEFAEGKWKAAPKFTADICEGRIVTVPILFVKPTTFVNRSGEAVKKLVSFYGLNAAEQLLVCSDDIDLPLGELRFRSKGGPGTHNGLRSVVDHIGEAFPRLRIGLGTPPSGADLATWVLNRVTAEEKAAITQALTQAPALVRNFVLGDS